MFQNLCVECPAAEIFGFLINCQKSMTLHNATDNKNRNLIATCWILLDCCTNNHKFKFPTSSIFVNQINRKTEIAFDPWMILCYHCL